MSHHPSDDEKQPGGGRDGGGDEAAFAFPARDPNLRLEALVAMAKGANEENSCVSFCVAVSSAVSWWGFILSCGRGGI